MTIQLQFDYLKKITSQSNNKCYEKVENKIIKSIYLRKSVNNKEGVIEENHEFYLEGNNIVEKISIRESEIAIFSKNMFVLPEGCSFGEPIKEEHKYYDNAVEIAYRFGMESLQRDSLHKVKWRPLPEIIKEIEYILLEGAGYRIANRRADRAFFSFQNEYYLITGRYVLSKRHSEAQIDGEKISTYKTAMDLVLSVGIHKFQFGITDNGGD